MTTKLKLYSRRLLSFGLFLTAGVLLLGGCSEEDGITGNGDGPAVRFNAGITATARTTNGGDAWSPGDPVGIFMLRNGGQLSDASDIEESNVKYTISNPGSGELTGTPIYYPAGNATVDFIAYYPYSGTVVPDGYKYVVSVADQGQPENIDVLYAKAENKSRDDAPVSLVFAHVLSKVTFNVNPGTGFDAAAIAGLTTATIEGMPAGGSISLQDGTVTAGVTGDIGMLKAASATPSYAATFSAIIVPQPSGSGRKVVFTIHGVRYEGSLPDSDAFVKGNHYTYPVTVNETGVLFGEPSIGKWTSRDQNTSEATKINIETVFIPGGTFLMGTTGGGPNGDETQHQVTLTRDFYTSKYEITNAQYAAFLNAVSVGNSGYYETANNGPQRLIQENPWGLQHEGGLWQPQEGKTNFPVVCVTWYGADEFARWIGGSLPTEAQWEYACRGGTGTAYSFGDNESDLATYAWYGSNSGNQTREVGTKAANPWGLYDMHGNVWEWCLDSWNGSDYSSAAAVDPVSPDPGSSRVLRGGSWNGSAQRCRSAYRDNYYPGNYRSDIGFRVVFVP